MPIKLKSISITAFRGIPSLPLLLDGRSLLVKGENGTGKSSIIEAIEYFFTGKIKNFEGIQSLSQKRHSHHVKFKPKQLSVEMVFNPGGVNFERKLGSGYQIPGQFTEFFETASSGTFILRRSQILEFIISQPAQRSQVINTILGIDSLDGVEISMKRILDEANANCLEYSTQILTKFSEISEILGEDINSFHGILPQLNVILETGKKPITSFDQLNKYSKDLMKGVKSSPDGEIFSKIKEASQITRVQLIEDSIVDGIISVSKDVDGMIQDRYQSISSMKSILNSGKSLIIGDQLDSCPLCEQGIDREKLLKNIDKRLKIHQELSKEAEEIIKKSVKFKSIVDAMILRMEKVLKLVESEKTLKKEMKKLQKSISYYQALSDQISYLSRIEGIVTIADLKKAVENDQKHWQKISGKCDIIVSNLKLSDKDEEVLSKITIITSIKDSVNNIERINSNSMKAQKNFHLARDIYETFSSIKKRKIQEVYDSIQDTDTIFM